MEDIVRSDSRLAPSQWETSLQSNDVSHWLGAILESALITCNHYHAADALLASMVLIGFDGNIPPSAPEWLITCVYFIPPKLELCLTFFVIHIISFPPISQTYFRLHSHRYASNMYLNSRLSLLDHLSKLLHNCTTHMLRNRAFIITLIWVTIYQHWTHISTQNTSNVLIKVCI